MNSQTRGRRALSLVLVWFGLFALYALTANSSSLAGDTEASAWQAWVIATTGSPDLSPFVSDDELVWDYRVGDQTVTNRFAGAVLYAVPFYWVAAITDPNFSPWPGALAGAATAALAVIFMFLALRTVVGPIAAKGASAFFALGTATWAVSADGQWPHGPAQASLAAGMLALAHRRIGLAGLALGLGISTRPHLAVAALVVGLGVAWTARSFTLVLRFGLGTLPGVASLIFYNGWVFGRWGPTNGLEVAADGSIPGGTAGLSHLLDNLAGTLLSPGRGVLVLYPVLVVLAPLLARAWRSATSWERISAVAGLAYLLAQLALNRYSGGWWFFGSRLTIETLTMSFPLFVRAWTCLPISGAWRTIARAALLWTVITHALGALALPPAVTSALVDPWTFYDPLIVLQRWGFGGSLLVLLALAIIVLAGVRLLARPPSSSMPSRGYRVPKGAHGDDALGR